MLFCYMVCVWCSLGVTIYVLLTYVHGFYFMYFDRVSCFSLGTWIGSNDLIMGSVCVTDKIYETTAWQKWGKVRKFMKQDYGNNEPVILGNEASSKHAFCLWKLSEGILQSIIDFWSFLSLTQSLLNHFGFFDVMLHTCPAQFNRSIRNRFWQCWGWSNHSWCRGSTATTTTTTTTTTTSSSAKLAPGPARHELTHLRTLILGEVGLATMQDHGRAQWLWLLSWHDSNHLSDRHHLVFLHHSKLCWFPWILSTT